MCISKWRSFRVSAKSATTVERSCWSSPRFTADDPTTLANATPWTSSCGRPHWKTSRLGVALGAGPTRLAHRVLRLALRELGVTLDVHGGGRDLAYPHHECEAAQSETVTASLSSSTGCTWGSSDSMGEDE